MGKIQFVLNIVRVSDQVNRQMLMVKTALHSNRTKPEVETKYTVVLSNKYANKCVNVQVDHCL